MKKTETAPPYVVLGTYIEKSSVPYMGDKTHPYGLSAWQDKVRDEWRIYPNKEAAKADGGEYANRS